ncbi:MAG: penicillin-binding protein [Pseudomonadota bacterium]
MWRERRFKRLALVLLGGLLLFLAADRLYPLPPSAFAGAHPPGTVLVLANDGTPLRAWRSSDGALRHPTPLEAVSPLYLEALLRVEDRWFWWHPGINLWAMVRALGLWVSHGRIVSGGSTLTMQVARLLEMNTTRRMAPRSVRTKLRQMFRALQLEWHLSKREILVLYLNHAPMGGEVQGVETATRAYLGKSAQHLSHAEAALLVALPQNPSRWRPDREPQKAQAARDKVLQRLEDLGVWSNAIVTDARIERVFAPPLKARWIAPLAAERLRQAHPQPPKGLIHSTLDAGLQIRLEQMLTDRLPSLPAAVSMAALVVNNDTLAMEAYAGSADFTDDRRAAHVDMVRGVRSPGSTLKPFLYALALDDGLVHSESLLSDAPQHFGGYAPGNFQASFTGPVSVSEALQRSLNVPAVDVLERVGPERFAAVLRNAGLKLRMPAGAVPNLSLILGGGGTTLEELVGAYTALARQGMAGQPRLTPDAPQQDTRLMSAGAAFIVREILEHGGRPGAPFRDSATRVAWKTGTSFGFRDAWAIGVTDRYTVGVWVGRPDGTPNPGFFGANTAAPLVRDVLAALNPESAPAVRPPPAGVVAVDICWPTGLSAEAILPEHCLLRRKAWTLEGTTPPTLPERGQTTGWIQTTWVDAHSRQRLRAGCTPSDPQAKVEAISHPRWPTLLQPWIESDMRHPVESWPWHPACLPRTLGQQLRISGLDAHSVIHIAPGRREAVLPLHAVGSSELVHWLLDGRLVGSTQSLPTAAQTSTQATPTSLPSVLRLSLTQAGPYALTALDASGRYGQVRFVVKQHRQSN